MNSWIVFGLLILMLVIYERVSSRILNLLKDLNIETEEHNKVQKIFNIGITVLIPIALIIVILTN